MFCHLNSIAVAEYILYLLFVLVTLLYLFLNLENSKQPFF